MITYDKVKKGPGPFLRKKRPGSFLRKKRLGPFLTGDNMKKIGEVFSDYKTNSNIADAEITKMN